jgi:sterol desaturase/sphingolipid hydroxylase (fatty acid hydroxylase superfamily)
MEWLLNTFARAQQALFESVVQPLVYALGLGGWLEQAFNATLWFMVGAIQIVLVLAVIGPLQRWRPVEPMMDRATIRTDILYTLIHRLGLFRLALFFTLEPVFDAAFGALRAQGVGTLHLDQFWPGVTDLALVSLLIYLVVFDFVDYWIHRAQHQFNWWWQLHSLHHAQRQMTMWSDNRNHLLDDVLRDSILAITAQLIGVAPEQFVAVVAITQLCESFSHANLRLWYGRIGERLLVSPRFHRLHHAMGIGHEWAPPSSAQKIALGGHNFGVLLPWWDVLFRTGNFEQRYSPTGVRDQVEQGRPYGAGFWQQQWLGLLRLVGRA